MTRRTPAPPLVTPNGRYLVVRGRLWRRADPGLGDERRRALVASLMGARRAVAAARRVGDAAAEAAAHTAANAAKHGLGERGPVWWTDGDADLNRHLARNTGYAAWFESQADGAESATGGPDAAPAADPPNKSRPA